MQEPVSACIKPFFDKHEYIAVDTAYGDTSWDYSRLDFICDLGNLPFSDNAFDFIICAQVLEHVKKPLLVLNEAYRTLKHGSTIYLSAPQGWGVHQVPNDYYRFTCHGLQYLFEKAGFKVIYIKPSCGYFSYLANRLTVFAKNTVLAVKKSMFKINHVSTRVIFISPFCTSISYDTEHNGFY